MLFPKKVKHRKMQKGRIKGISSRANTLSFGSYGLVAMGSIWLTSRQIEAARRAIIRFLQKGGKLWIRVFPDKPITRKPPEVGMGGGKGAVEFYVFSLKPGRIIFEIDGIPESAAKEAFRLASFKLPVKTKFIKK